MSGAGKRPWPRRVILVRPSFEDLGQNEIADAGGRAYVTLDTENNQIAWVIEYHSLSGAIVAIHIRGPAGPGEAADVAIGIDNGSETVGKLTGTARITPEKAQHLLNGMMYVNIHTELNGPGEVRGQLIRQ